MIMDDKYLECAAFSLQASFLCESTFSTIHSGYIGSIKLMGNTDYGDDVCENENKLNLLFYKFCEYL